MDTSYSLNINSAKARYDLIHSPISYYIHLTLSESEFSGYVVIDFITKKPSSSLFIDYAGDQIRIARMGTTSLPTARNENKLSLGQLQAGPHKLHIEFSSSYSSNGTGLHRFKDPSDSNTYIYSYCFPYYANKIYPCFDQPDLKGTFTIVVDTFKTWTVLSNEFLVSNEDLDDSYSRRSFGTTPIMSTYVTAVICGDFIGESEIYSRTSLDSFIARDMISNLLDIGKKAYAKFFGIEMQFSKCTQVFCPEFNMGAMENAGCVAISDSHVWKEKPVRSELNWLQNVVLHELCHMWFGNFVTLKWWDDLWLNESFATFLSYFITFKEIDGDIWIDFLVNKLKAYSSDTLESTHPVYMYVEITDEAISNLDTITYWKGASLLKNLAFIIGEDVFSDGLKRYFKNFGWSNVGLADFVESMQSPFLANWVSEWVETKGLNSLQVEFTNENGKLKEVKFVQKNVSGETLRNHYLLVQGYSEEGKVFEEKVHIKNVENGFIEELKGLDAIRGLVVNANDHGYVQVILDEQSELFFFREKHIKNMNSINRGVLWHSLWNRVESLQMKGSELIVYISELLIFEDLEQVIDIIISHFASPVINDYTPKSHIAEYSHKLFDAIMAKLEVCPDNKCLQRKIFNIAYTEEDIKRSYEYSKTLNRGERWKGIMLLSTISTKEEVKNILKEELKYDTSDVSVLFKNYCKAAAVDNKEKTWNECVNNKKFSLAQANYLMNGFWQTKDLRHMEGYFEKYFEVANWVVNNHQREYAENFLRYLLPKTDNVDSLIASLSALNFSQAWARRFVVETVESLQKCKIHLQSFI